MLGHLYPAQLQPAEALSVDPASQFDVLLSDCFIGTAALTAVRQRTPVICRSSGGVGFDLDIRLKINVFQTSA
jgi:hypothetical protein